MGKIKIGQIVNAVGLKGEVKIYNYSADPYRYEDLDEFWLLKKPNVEYAEDSEFGKPYMLEDLRYQGQMVIAKFVGIDNRNAAEALKFMDVFMSEDDLPELEEGEYYVKDLIGMDIIENDEKIGTLVEVKTDTAQELYCIKIHTGKIVYLPAVKAFIKNVDLDARKITVELPKGLLEI